MLLCMIALRNTCSAFSQAIDPAFLSNMHHNCFKMMHEHRTALMQFLHKSCLVQAHNRKMLPPNLCGGLAKPAGNTTHDDCPHGSWLVVWQWGCDLHGHVPSYSCQRLKVAAHLHQAGSYARSCLRPLHSSQGVCRRGSASAHVSITQICKLHKTEQSNP